jgi:hypothetical protein
MSGNVLPFRRVVDEIETEVARDVSDGAHKYSDNCLAEIATLAAVAAIFMRREGEHQRADRFDRLSQVCRGILLARCLPSEKLREPPL